MKSAHTGYYWAKLVRCGLSFCSQSLALGSSRETRKALDLAPNPRPTKDWVTLSKSLTALDLCSLICQMKAIPPALSTGVQWERECSAACALTAPLPPHWATAVSALLCLPCLQLRGPGKEPSKPTMDAPPEG